MAEEIREGWNVWTNTSGYLVADGWRLVGESGGGYNIGYLYNVNTKESAHVCLYDYDEPRNEDLFWRHMPIDKDARAAWDRDNGVICEGATAKVVKGRKVPIGYTGVVAKTRKVYDRYDRWVATYAVFEDGTSTNIANCVRVD